MALTLPYPSMNFVPLDVLTAAEQNQLVANIEYIANQFPITSSNIDWATLGSVAYRPGDSIPLLYPCFAQITVLDDSTRAKLFIPLSKGSTASSVSFTSGGGGSSFGYVIDSANTAHAIYLQANQTTTGVFITGGVAFDVNLSSSVGTVYATGNLYMNAGSISFS